jgi:hypothetical protein
VKAAGKGRELREVIKASSYVGPADQRNRACSITLHPPGGPFHDVETARPDGSPVPGIMFSTWAKDREGAREVWTQREQELRTAGYERV